MVSSKTTIPRSLPKKISGEIVGADGGTRTLKPLLALAPQASAYTNSATSAYSAVSGEIILKDETLGKTEEVGYPVYRSDLKDA